MPKQFPYTFIRKKFVKTAEATVPIQCKALQYGQGVFTGVRGNWNDKDKNLYLFRLEDHFKRFQEAAKIMAMRLPYTYPKFKKLTIDLIKKNKAKGSIYLRPTLYSASTALTPRFDNPDDDLAIYMIPLQNYFDAAKGLNTCISSYRRIDDDVLSTKAKSTGLYASSAIAKTEALRNGYDETIFLNRDGKVCEASGANIFGVKNGVVWTPPLGSNILDGITRRTLIELIKNELDMELREENFDRSMLYSFDELFLSGTAAKVSWIKSVDKRPIGSAEMGRLTKKLQTFLDQAMTAELPCYEKWCTAVY